MHYVSTIYRLCTLRLSGFLLIYWSWMPWEGLFKFCLAPWWRLVRDYFQRWGFFLLSLGKQRKRIWILCSIFVWLWLRNSRCILLPSRTQFNVTWWFLQVLYLEQRKLKFLVDKRHSEFSLNLSLETPKLFFNIPI